MDTELKVAISTFDAQSYIVEAMKDLSIEEIEIFKKSLIEFLTPKPVVKCNEWVAFNKQMPELEKSVLAVDIENGYMEVVDVQEIEGKLCICTNNGYSLFSDAKPTHWMPLPLSPKVI